MPPGFPREAELEPGIAAIRKPRSAGLSLSGSFVMLDVVARSARSPIRLLLGLVLGTALGGALAQGDAKRGEYLAKAGGCIGCHTEEKKDAVAFAGGRAPKSPFGTFYRPNLTPHAEAGIRRRAQAHFLPATREGGGPHGKNYFPPFPP